MFRDRKIAVNAQVGVELARAYENAAGGIPELELRRRYERSQIEPTVDGPASGRQVAVRDAIRPIASSTRGIGNSAGQSSGEVISGRSRPCATQSPIADNIRCNSLIQEARRGPNGRS